MLAATTSAIASAETTVTSWPSTTNPAVAAIAGALREARGTVEALADGVGQALDGMRGSLDRLGAVEAGTGRIETIVEGIALVAVQIGMLAVSGAIEAARRAGVGVTLNEALHA